MLDIMVLMFATLIAGIIMGIGAISAVILMIMALYLVIKDWFINEAIVNG